MPLPGPDGKKPIDGNLGIRTALELERIWTNARERGDFPLKMNHTQWPGTGKMGDPIFDTFMKTQVQFAGATGHLVRPAGIALLEMIGTPVILFTHSQGGGFGFDITESRPQPRSRDGDRRARRAAVRRRRHGQGGAESAQSEFVGADEQALRVRSAGQRAGRPAGGAGDEIGSARRSALLDAGGARAQARRGGRNIRVLAISANGTYHRVYDPCIPKFLNQAGVKTDFVRLEDVGISGNSHMMMLERNSDDVIEFVVDWIKDNVPATVTSTTVGELAYRYRGDRSDMKRWMSGVVVLVAVVLTAHGLAQTQGEGAERP